MAVVIREADLHSDRQMIIRFLFENLTPNSNDARYEWLYLDNPAGHARIWIAWDTNTNRTIGISAAIPRVLNVKGANQLCWILADFCIDRSHRSLGPALKLQRESLEAAERSEIFCCIDFPSQSMVAIYSRLGIPVSCELGRFAKPLTLNHKLRKSVPVPLLAEPVSWIGNCVLRLVDLKPKSATLVLNEHQNEMGEEFSAVARKALKSFGLFTDRPAPYLNWRYLRNPIQRHLVLTFRRDGELVGYAIADRGTNGEAGIQEILCLPEDNLFGQIARGAGRYFRYAGMQTASFWQSHCSGVPVPVFDAGYYLRDSSPVFMSQSKFVAESAGSIPIVSEWLLMNGDRDS